MRNLQPLPCSLVTVHGEPELRVHLNSGITQISECFKGLYQLFPDYMNYQATVTQLTALSRMILITELLHLCLFLAETY